MPTIKKAMMGAAGAGGGTQLWSWGRNRWGQSGQGNTTGTCSPAQVGSDENWLSTAGSHGSNAGLKDDGTAWAWGRANFGQTGQGNTTDICVPTQIGSLTNWASIANGGDIIVALKSDGTLWSWGNNTNFGLGQGNSAATASNRSSPVQIGSGTDWESVVSTDNTAVLAIKTGGTLWTWGIGYGGRLGHGNTTDYCNPTQVGSGTDWARGSMGNGSGAAITDGGTLWTWGDAGYGQTGQGNDTDISAPVQVGSLTDWDTVYLKSDASLAIKTDGTLWVWGKGENGQLGLGSTTNYSSPVQVGSLTDWGDAIVGTSGYHQSTVVVKADGTAWSWGRNNYGALPLNTSSSSVTTPRQVGSGTDWTHAGSKTYFGGTLLKKA